jgi:hypothetical protein
MMDYDAVTYSFSPSVDSLAEFKVETSSYSAESGGAPSAQVNIITKSGTNQLRGTLWEFNRNDALTQSYDAIAGKSVKSPRLNRNQFGANIALNSIFEKSFSPHYGSLQPPSISRRLRCAGRIKTGTCRTIV